MFNLPAKCGLNILVEFVLESVTLSRDDHGIKTMSLFHEHDQAANEIAQYLKTVRCGGDWFFQRYMLTRFRLRIWRQASQNIQDREVKEWWSAPSFLFRCSSWCLLICNLCSKKASAFPKPFHIFASRSPKNRAENNAIICEDDEDTLKTSLEPIIMPWNDVFRSCVELRTLRRTQRIWPPCFMSSIKTTAH